MVVGYLNYTRYFSSFGPTTTSNVMVVQVQPTTIYTFFWVKISFSSLYFHAILTLVPIFFSTTFTPYLEKTRLILVLSLTAKFYVTNGTIKIIIKFFLTLKNVTSTSKLKN